MGNRNACGRSAPLPPALRPHRPGWPFAMHLGERPESTSRKHLANTATPGRVLPPGRPGSTTSRRAPKLKHGVALARAGSDAPAPPLRSRRDISPRRREPCPPSRRRRSSWPSAAGLRTSSSARNEFPTAVIRLGRRIVVPRAPLLELLDVQGAAGTPVDRPEDAPESCDEWQETGSISGVEPGQVRGHIRRRGPSWMFVHELPRDPATGKRRRGVAGRLPHPPGGRDRVGRVAQPSRPATSTSS